MFLKLNTTEKTFNERKRVLYGFINYKFLDWVIHLAYIFMSYGVTDKQLKLFNFIKNYISKNIISPSYDEMKTAIGLKSKCGIAARIEQLEQRGWLKKLPGKNRSIQIIKI